MPGPVELTAELVVRDEAELGEGPVWLVDEQTLLWTDILGRRLLRYHPATRAHTVTTMDAAIGVAIPRRQGGLVLAADDGFRLLDRAGAVVGLIPVDHGRGPAVRFNDGKCDPAGRLLAGTLAIDGESGAARLFRLDPDLAVTELVSGLSISNGLAFTPDATTLYFIDSPERRVDVFDYDPGNGALANRRTAFDTAHLPGDPDGMAIDNDGCLWVAYFGGGCVRRHAPDGEVLAVVSLPVDQASSCAFGGPGLDELFITTAGENFTAEQRAAQPLAGSLFVVHPGVGGPAPALFGG